jgi:hypothetical protein
MSKSQWIWIVVILLALIIFLVWVFSSTNPQESRTNVPEGWKTATSSSGVTFAYSEDLGTKYIDPVDWPPRVQVSKEVFTCTEAGSENAPAGKSEKKIINRRTYCVTKETQGAAGSIYTQYAYATSRDDSVLIITFSLRFVQCANYPDLQKSECDGERSNFSIDNTVDKIAETARGINY